MPRSAAFTALVALALAGCFRLSAGDCKIICTGEGDCPPDMRCRMSAGTSYGLCASDSVLACNFPDAGVSQMDAATSDADAGTPLPPDTLCHDGTCLHLPDAVRDNLVLLLWPSNLPPAGSPVSVWADQSGHGNDARALDPAALPHVIADGVQLQSAEMGAGFVVVNSPSLDFGSEDFALVAVAGLSSADRPLSIAKKSDGARTNSRQVSLDWVLSSATTGRPQAAVDDTQIVSAADVAQPSVAVYTLYRSADHVELHLNGTVIGSADLPVPGLTTTNAADLYIGVANTFGYPADAIGAVAAVRGPVSSTALSDLELYLVSVFRRSPP